MFYLINNVESVKFVEIIPNEKFPQVATRFTAKQQNNKKL